MNALFTVVALVALGADPTADALLKEVISAAEQTAIRLKTEGAAWSARFELTGGLTVVVDTVQFPATSRLALKLTAGNQSQSLLTLITSEGDWLVDDGRSRGRYRPFEAPLPWGAAAYFLNASSLPMLTKEVVSGSDIVSVKILDVARVAVRSRGSGIQRENLRSMVAKSEGFAAQLAAAGKPVAPELSRQLANLKKQFDEGFLLIVDRQTGIILDRGIPPKEVHLLGFTWKGTGKGAEWEIRAKDWVDHTQPFSSEEMKDVIQIG